MNVVYCWHAFHNRKDQDSFIRLLNAVEARNRQIADMVSRKGTPYNPTALSAEILKKNGKMLDIPPFNWNVAEMRINGFAALADKTMKAYRIPNVPTLNSPKVAMVDDFSTEIRHGGWNETEIAQNNINDTCCSHCL